MKKYLVLTIAFLLSLTSMAQHIEVLQQGKSTSIRGLSVVDNNVAWISGSKGTIAITKDGGKTWDWKQVAGFEKSDFRDIEAFSSKEAIIMSSGTPALILKTTDGGATWQEKYRNADTAYFFDAMDFVGKKHGLILGDPIAGKFVLMETKDGGETWKMLDNRPDAKDGEAAFAASGTCLRVDKDGIGIVTGGSVARLIGGELTNPKWAYTDLPMAHGKSSQGAFSFSGIVFVGGDYANDKSTDGTAVYVDTMMISIKNGYERAYTATGYQSCVEELPSGNFLSTGTSGSNISINGGKSWSKIDDVSYNVCRKARHGKLVLLAGDHGRIGIFKP